MEKKTIGILGGMGPLATVDLFKKIVLNTQANCDQDHLHIIVDNASPIPDRTAAILSGGEDPVPAMQAAARNLEKAGADLIIMPCNTVHYFYEPVQAAVNIPVLHMIRLTAQELLGKGCKTAALLATNGCAKAGMYQKAMAEAGLTLLTPDPEQQNMVNGMVYDGIKAGNAAYSPDPLIGVTEDLLKKGAECVILGCTELPLAWDLYSLERYPSCDPTTVLARAAIRAAGGKVVGE